MATQNMSNAVDTFAERPPRRDRIGLLGRGMASNLAGLIVSGAVAIAITPIMIRGLGAFYYGVFMLANSVLSYYGLLSLGITTTVHRFVALSEGSGKRQVASETISTAVVLMAIMAALTMVITLAIVAVVPRFRLLSPDTIPLFRQVLLLLGASVALSFPTNPPAAYLRGVHRFDLINGIQAGGALIRGVAMWVLLTRGYGIVAVCWTTLATSVLLLIAHFASMQVLAPGLVRLRSGFQWHRIRQLFRFSFYVFLTGIGDYFRFQLDLVVIAKCIGIAAVTPYSVALTLTYYYQTIMTGFSGPLMTELITVDGAQESKTRNFFLKASKFSVLLATLGGVLLIANGKHLLQLWVGPQFVAVFATLVLLTIAHWSDRGQAPSLYLLYSRNRHHAMAYWTIAEGLLNLTLSIYLGRRMGIIGVALGTAIPMLIVKLAVQPLYTIRIVGSSISEYLKRAILQPVGIGVAVWFAAALLADHSVSLPALIVNVSWQFSLFALLTYAFGLSRDERQMLSERLAQFRFAMSRRAA